MRPKRHRRGAASTWLVWLLAVTWESPALAQGENEPGAHAPVAGKEVTLERAQELGQRATELYQAGKYAEAEPLAREALDLRESALGADHADVALSLNNLAAILYAEGRHDAARPLYERAISIHEKALGCDDPCVAGDLNNLAALLKTQGRYDDARALDERALAIWEKALGPDHPNVATSLHNLAGLLLLQGQYEAAKPLYERAVTIRERALGADHPDLATALNNLAQVQVALGRYESARPLYDRALAIREKALGCDHPDVALSLHNLAGLLQQLGQYENARPLYERALAIRERALGPTHPAVATTLHNLALVLQRQGQYDSARPLYERAVAIWEQSLGPSHPSVASGLSGLALLLKAQRKYDVAERLYARALAIEEANGGDRPQVAATLINMADLLRAQRRYEAARPLIERALAIREKALGPEHPDVAESLDRLGLLLAAQRDYVAARPLHERALAIRGKALGSEHPGVAESLRNLASLLQAEGRYAEARPLLERALYITELRVRRGLACVSGPERLALVRSTRSCLDEWLALAPALGITGYEEVLRFKGLVGRSEGIDRGFVRSGGVEPLRLDLLAVDRQLSGLVKRFPRDQDRREAWRKSYAELSAKRESLLRELARLGTKSRELAEAIDGVMDRAVAELCDDHATCERIVGVQAGLMHEAIFDFLKTGRTYVAWVVLGSGEPVRVDLGDAEAVNAAAEAFTADAAQGGAWEQSGARLAGLVLAPLRAYLPAGTRRLYVCPDASLAAVPFAAMPGSTPGKVLLDEFEVVHLDTAQDVRRYDRESGEGALVVGGVDYDAPEVEASPPRQSSLLVGVDRAPLEDREWISLPATEREATLLGKRLGGQATVLTGSDATEAQLRSLARGKALLHLATHGYVSGNRLAGLIRREEDARRLDPMLERQVAAGYDPMLLSGLVLAGANSVDVAKVDDGLLTAAEASWLDLGGCDLVVLSACDTGRGTPAAGEGTLGLVRGFRLAGARRVVASLWKVDDDATGALMERFYEGLLDRKLEPAQALREAALALRDYKDASGKRPFGAPRYWAAFVAYGR